MIVFAVCADVLGRRLAISSFQFQSLLFDNDTSSCT